MLDPQATMVLEGPDESGHYEHRHTGWIWPYHCNKRHHPPNPVSTARLVYYACYTNIDSNRRRERPVPIFSRKREQEVQSFVLKVVNNNCSELEALIEGPRLEGRVRLSIVVLVIPVEKDRPVVERTFAAVSKEFSTSGLALIVDSPRATEESIIGFRWEREMRFVRAEARHLNPMGAGFYQLGLQMIRMVTPGEYPELESVTF